MTFADESAAEIWLHRVSYYRMSGYWYPLLADRVNHTFKPGATFEQAVNLYEFDSRLRELVFRNIGRIEVAVRTQMAYVMSIAKGGTWFSDTSLFTNTAQHENTLTQDLQQLFSEFPSVHAGALGFPQNWEQESLWQ